MPTLNPLLEMLPGPASPSGRAAEPGAYSAQSNPLLPAQPADPNDYSGRYNTQLSPAEEAAYQAWGQQQATSDPRGKNPASDIYNYDMRGFWKSGASLSGDGHAGDAYKKPNHPTFSSQSQYHGADGAEGGVWSGGQDQPWAFAPSPHNLRMVPAADLQRYFDGPAEGGRSRLILPPQR